MTPFQQLQSLKTLYVRNRTVDAVQIPNNWDPEVGWVLNFLHPLSALISRCNLASQPFP